MDENMRDRYIIEIHAKVTGMDEKLNSHCERIEALESDVELLKSKPAKRFEGAVSSMIGAIIGAVVGAASNLFKH